MKEFKKFISRGNVVDMAFGLILATYFGAIIKSLVNNIIMPPIGQFLGGVDFSDMKYIIQPESEGSLNESDSVAEIAIYYGQFINTIITFIIVAFAIFMLVKLYNKMKEKMEKKEAEEPSTPPVPTKEEILLTEIRDLLKK
ncbi:MAG: large-conductance mechanosensitive channel protein MscL [Bacteroidia bacterium]|nr:large-conductance mechanosensitive channel protein MscL [Bacteroidia bacterium]